MTEARQKHQSCRVGGRGLMSAVWISRSGIDEAHPGLFLPEDPWCHDLDLLSRFDESSYGIVHEVCSAPITQLFPITIENSCELDGDFHPRVFSPGHRLSPKKLDARGFAIRFPFRSLPSEVRHYEAQAPREYASSSDQRVPGRLNERSEDAHVDLPIGPSRFPTAGASIAAPAKYPPYIRIMVTVATPTCIRIRWVHARYSPLRRMACSSDLEVMVEQAGQTYGDNTHHYAEDVSDREPRSSVSCSDYHRRRRLCCRQHDWYRHQRGPETLDDGGPDELGRPPAPEQRGNPRLLVS